MTGTFEITPDNLLMLVGTPFCPRLIDVTTDEDFVLDPYVIPGSVRWCHTDIAALSDMLTGDPVVLICQKGKKLSQGAAAWLLQDGVQARFLSGGMHGWREHPGAPRVPARNLPDRIHGATTWVAPVNPDPDVLAALWLIRRFIDRDARILFVDDNEIDAVGARYGATCLPQTSAGSGALETMTAVFELNVPALKHLSKMVKRIGSQQETSGSDTSDLSCLFTGLSRQSRTESDLLEAAVALYDALYSWASETGNIPVHHARLQTA